MIASLRSPTSSALLTVHSVLVLVLADPGSALAAPTPVKLCVESALVAPAKPDGAGWDGLKKGSDKAAAKVAKFAAKAAVAVATGGTSVVAEVAASVGTGFVMKGTKAPDVFAVVELGGSEILKTLPVRDTATPVWTARQGHCSKPLSKKELRTQSLRVVLLDADAAAHDPVGQVSMPRGLKKGDLKRKRLTVVKGRKPFGKGAGLGSIIFLELSLHDLGDQGSESFRVLYDDSVEVPAKRLLVPEIQIDDPTELLVEWRSQGLNAGIKGARDDKLMGVWLTDPRGKTVPGTKTKKRTEGRFSVKLRSPGSYKLHLSNAGAFRLSGRRVTYKVRVRPL